nr:putative ribonuclease H-like domain-containing protein [Tanacetum cinerariifolium]
KASDGNALYQEGEVVSTDNAIPAGVSISAGTVAAVVVSPQSKTEFALVCLSIEEKHELMSKLDYEIANQAKWNNSGELGIDDSKVSIFHTNNDDLEGQPIYNRFASVDHMKAVPLSLTGNYMPPSKIPDIDESQMVYGKKATDSSEIKTNDDSISYFNDSVLFDFSDRVSSTNLTASSQGATPSNAGSHEDDLDSDDEPDVFIIQSTPTPVVPIVDEAKTQNNGTKSDHATTNADNLDELTELQALQRQEQAGKEESDQLGLAFPSLHPILGVGSTPIGSSVSAGSTPPVSAGSTPPMSLCASPISTDRHFIPAGRPTGSAGRPVSAGRPGSTSKPVSCFLSQEEPTTVAQALAYPDWVEATQAEMQQFKNQKVWVLVTLPDGKRAIGTKWILKNKRDARGIVCRNKARLVDQGHIQEEGIDYTDVFAPVSKIKAIRLFLAFASFIGFKVYQMDVKSAFLYGKIAEEVNVTQPRGFEDPNHPKKVYKVVKALYGLHQSPRAFICQSLQFCWSQTSHTKSSDEILKPFYWKGFSKQTSMCLVCECWTGLHEMAMAAFESQYI